MAEKKYRYPGVPPFETGDADVFFGRDDDRQMLADLVEAEKTVLLYSRSGLGKSSLLNAALIPELMERGYQPYYIRLGMFQADSLSPVQSVLRYTALAGQRQMPVTFLHRFANRTFSLWSVFKAVQIDSSPDEPSPVAAQTAAQQEEQELVIPPTEKPIVLIFDQFEEIGSYDEQEITDFKQQLAELLYTPVPQAYRAATVDKKLLAEPLTNEELKLLYKPLYIKAVFAIRSDQLSVVNGLSDYLPNILKLYYELTPLSRTQAAKAIMEPAKKNGNFVTGTFIYQPEAVEKIIRSLNVKNEIDTAQLQILLQFVEQDIVEKRKDTDISASDLGNLLEVYQNYYRNSLDKLKNNQAAARQLIEDKLIIGGRRISYDEALCLEQVSPQTLKTLIDIRLLRREPNTTGSYSYEISHDSLIEPILQAQKERRQEETERIQKAEEERKRNEEADNLRLAFEKQQEEERRQRVEEERKRTEEEAEQRAIYEAQQQEQKRRRANQRRILYIVAIAGLISLGCCVIAIIKSFQVKKTLEQVQIQKDSTQIALNRLVRAEVARKKLEKDQLLTDIRTYSTSNDQYLVKQAQRQIDILNTEIKNLEKSTISE